jgi:hypothetical protein
LLVAFLAMIAGSLLPQPKKIAHWA